MKYHVCTHARTHAHTHEGTHARAHACMHTRTLTPTHARTHARMHLRTHAHARTGRLAGGVETRENAAGDDGKGLPSSKTQVEYRFRGLIRMHAHYHRAFLPDLACVRSRWKYPIKTLLQLPRQRQPSHPGLTRAHVVSSSSFSSCAPSLLSQSVQRCLRIS